MEWILWLIGAVTFLVWGIPLIKYGCCRLWVYAHVLMLRLTKRAFVVFRHPFSLWALNRSKHADMLVVCDRKAFLVKFGGVFKRATRIAADSPTQWRFRRYWRSVGPMSAPLMADVFTREVTIPFDLVSDTVRLRAATHRSVLLDDYTAVYLLAPRPLGMTTADGSRRELFSGDDFFGMTLYTAKHLFRVCHALGNKTLVNAEKEALKTAFRA